MRAFFCHTALVLLLALPAQAQQRVRMLEHNYAFDRFGKVTVENYKGSIKVQTWSRDEIQIDVQIEAENFDGLIMLPEVDIAIGGTTENVKVETEYRRAIKKLQDLFGEVDSKRLPLVHYSIHVPSTADVRIDDYMSSIYISDLASNVNVYTYKGDIDVVNVHGPLTVDTYRGVANVRFDQYVPDSKFDTFEGRIAVQIPPDAGFTLAMQLGDDPRAMFAAAPEFVALTDVRRAYLGEINGGGPRLNLTTHSGSLRLGGERFENK